MNSAYYDVKPERSCSDYSGVENEKFVLPPKTMSER